MPIIYVPEIIWGTTQRETHLHMTGGILAVKNASGWVMGPALKDGALGPIGVFADGEIGNFCLEIGVTVLGGDEVSIGEVLQSRTWSPILGEPALPSSADDIWQGIAVTAQDTGDTTYSSIAHNLCISLRAAGIRLRDASDEHHKQLIAALLEGKKPNLRFTNISLYDLHLAFHSLLSEMASARDYLASLIALEIDASPEIDSMNGLVKWVKQKVPSRTITSGLRLLLNAYDRNSEDPWLFLLSEYRNLFLHRKPMQASELARWLILKESPTSFGNIMTTQMRISLTSRGGMVDAFELFSSLYNKLCRLAYGLATEAKYQPSHTQILAKARMQK